MWDVIRSPIKVTNNWTRTIQSSILWTLCSDGSSTKILVQGDFKWKVIGRKGYELTCFM